MIGGAANPGVSPHRYWRVLVQETYAPNNDIAAGQLYFFDSIAASGTGVATGGTPIWGSSNSANDDGTFMFDGNETTKWYARPTDATSRWVGYDFGAANPKSIVEFEWVNVQQAGDLHIPKVLKLQWSDNGATWTDSFSKAITWEPDNIRLRVNAENVYRPFVDPNQKRFWRVLMSQTVSEGNSWIATYLGFHATAGGPNLLTDPAKLIARVGGNLSPLLVDAGDVNVGLGDVSPTFPLAYAGYDFGFGANVAVNSVTLGKDMSGSSQFWYLPKLAYIQYSNDGRVWATSYVANFPQPWPLGYAKQEVARAVANPVPAGSPVNFNLAVTGVSTSAFAIKGYRFRFFDDRMMTKLRPKNTVAFTARVYVVEFDGSGGTIKKVLYDSQPISLTVGMEITIPPIYCRKLIHYGVVIQDPTGAAVNIEYRSVKVSDSYLETRDVARLNSATPLAAGTVLSYDVASPYNIDLTHDGVTAGA
jgi:hypothetical protein